LAGAAAAADFPARIYTKAPPPVAAVYNWSGCYVGGDGGGIWSRNNWSLPDMGGLPVSSHDVNSWLAGVQVGCNYQFNGGWVIGLQGDYDFADGTGSSPHATAPTLTDQSHISGLGSVTGRVGYAWDRFLGYVKGGGAWERNSYLQYFPALGTTFSTSEATRDGWTVGVGGEYAITQNLTAFIEYDYYDFGNDTLTFATVLGTFPHVSIRETQSVVKAGLNWKFDWASPVVAKY
ncbi:MAG: outer membrane beta-barrel protein, partial [Xanthobacteraceae bacterium]